MWGNLITNRIYFGWLTTRVSLHPIVTCIRYFSGGNIPREFLELYFRSFSPFGPTQNFHCIRKSTTVFKLHRQKCVARKTWTNFSTKHSTGKHVRSDWHICCDCCLLLRSSDRNRVEPEKLFSSRVFFDPLRPTTHPRARSLTIPNVMSIFSFRCHVENLLVKTYNIIENRARNLDNHSSTYKYCQYSIDNVGFLYSRLDVQIFCCSSNHFGYFRYRDLQLNTVNLNRK